MNTFKHAATIVALSAAGLLSTQAYAAEAGIKAASNPQKLSAFSQDDINGMFETSGKPMKLAALSQKEMKETEGAWLWLAAPIAIGLGTAAMTYATSEGNATGRQLAESFGAGFGSTVTSFSPAGRVLGTAGNAIAGVFGGGVGAGAAGSAYDAATSAD
ncbi:MAG: hypothetical protein D8H94_04220 [Cardiobacterium sp.]|nr:MAG: hypothetical protein D8H94_04220 [Cardiobacterium sp.]